MDGGVEKSQTLFHSVLRDREGGYHTVSLNFDIVLIVGGEFIVF